MNKLVGMPRPNVVNLKECWDRRQYMSNELLALGEGHPRFYEYERYENSNVKAYCDAMIEPYWIDKGTTTSHLLTIKDWFDNTDEDVGIFFEDDVDFSTVQYWSFTFKDFIEKLGSKWGALQLSIVHEGQPNMVPRKREQQDHGLQCYMLKRKYASKLVKFYFDNGDDTIHYRMPVGAALSLENAVLWGFDRVYTFPLFNHNVNEFTSKNIFSPEAQVDASVRSYHVIRSWWENTGRNLSLDELFENHRIDY
jgi:hypothetical protein